MRGMWDKELGDSMYREATRREPVMSEARRAAGGNIDAASPNGRKAFVRLLISVWAVGPPEHTPGIVASDVKSGIYGTHT
ncbi:Carotenoid isomerase (A) [Gracilaria domingensis]|nr:Carotenoid isomerase (A) [Gracilaria domingensis]